MRDAHPLVDALLAWRKAERVATTYGYAWLDEHVGADGRLRGAGRRPTARPGRMTASAGLHNMPADLRGRRRRRTRPRLRAGRPRPDRAPRAGRRVRRRRASPQRPAPTTCTRPSPSSSASTGRRPRSPCSARCTARPPGHGAQALRRLETAYPVAMGYLADADVAGQVGRDVRTVRRAGSCRMGTTNANEVSDRDARRRAAARGPLRPQRHGPGRGGRAVQDVGRHRARPRRRRSVPASCCACTTSCSSTRPPTVPRPRWRWSPTASRRRRAGGRPTAPSASSPTSAPSGGWSDAKS